MNTLYYCNPFLHETCKKQSCYLNEGPCHMTTQKAFSLKGKDGEPLEAPANGIHDSNRFQP